MGYTHYWLNRPEVLENYEALCADVDKIGDYCASAGIELVGYDRLRGHYMKGAPLHNSRYISFRDANLNLDPFYMSQDYDDRYEGGFNTDNKMSCETSHGAYDLAVCLVLLRMAEIVPGFKFESDGDLDSEPAWLTAKEAYETIFGTQA
jgi:hypothetical protein